jgi:hypothetical protein
MKNVVAIISCLCVATAAICAFCWNPQLKLYTSNHDHPISVSSLSTTTTAPLNYPLKNERKRICLQLYGTFRTARETLPRLLVALGFFDQLSFDYSVIYLFDKDETWSPELEAEIHSLLSVNKMIFFGPVDNIFTEEQREQEEKVLKQYLGLNTQVTQHFGYEIIQDHFVARLYYRRFLVNQMREHFQERTGAAFDCVVRTRVDLAILPVGNKTFLLDQISICDSGNYYAAPDVIGIGTPEVINVEAGLGINFAFIWNSIQGQYDVSDNLATDLKDDNWIRMWVLMPEANLIHWMEHHHLSINMIPNIVIDTRVRSSDWQFVRYVSSPLEQAWLDSRGNWSKLDVSICQSELFHQQMAQYEVWNDFVENGPTNDFDPSIFSYLEYKQIVGGRKIQVPIEPLTAPLRHPFFCREMPSCAEDPFQDICQQLLVDLNYLLLPPSEKTLLEPTSKKYLFDLGGTPVFGKSLWLPEHYHSIGMEFDHVYAWEATKLDPDDVWNAIPPWMVHSFHWINVPCNESTSKLIRNPIEMIKGLRKRDFVVIKLDIDHPWLEMQFIDQILAPEVSAKIDVLFFEHHVKYVEMLRYWGHEPTQSFSDSLTLFEKLRKVGIRAHAWI